MVWTLGSTLGKNGVGIRIFLNRALGSITKRSAPQKNLRLVHTSCDESRTSPDEVAFKDSFAVLDNLDSDDTPHAPENGAANNKQVDKTNSEPVPCPTQNTQPTETSSPSHAPSTTHLMLVPSPEPMLTVNDLISIIRTEVSALERKLYSTVERDRSSLREWLESRGLPKVARVAQHEAYKVLNSYGVIRAKEERLRADLEVGRNCSAAVPSTPRLLTPMEIKDAATFCLTTLEAKGQSIEVTLAEFCTESGGWILPEDVPKVREMTHRILNGKEERVKL